MRFVISSGLLAVAMAAALAPLVAGEGLTPAPKPTATPRFSRSGNEVSVIVDLTNERQAGLRSGGPGARGTNPVGNPRSGHQQLTPEQVRLLQAEIDRRVNYLASLPECQGPLRLTAPECRALMADVDAAPAVALSRESVAAIAREAALSMTLPGPDIKVGPDPERNEWDMAVVGYPLWLWTTTPSTMSSSLSESGITLTLDASRRGVVYDMGDGKRVECATSTPWSPAVKPAAPSPDCGYTYAWPSLPKGPYTVTALSVWDVRWSALGYSGTVEVRTSASRQLPVGELQAVVLADDNG